MSRTVILTESAYQDLQDGARWWAEHRSAVQAERWYDGFLARLISLGESPERCPLAREAGLFPYELRETYYGLGARPTHRALFALRSDSIVVMAIRHVAQDDWKPE